MTTTYRRSMSEAERTDMAIRAGLPTTTYDYDRQAWIVNGRYVRCGHPESMACGCYGRLHAAEIAPAQKRS